jgi:hypothetical protein
MAGITLAQAIAERDYWLAESRKLSYSIGGRSVSRDQRHALEMLKTWETWVSRLSNGGNGGVSVTAITPIP